MSVIRGMPHRISHDILNRAVEQLAAAARDGWAVHLDVDGAPFGDGDGGGLTKSQLTTAAKETSSSDSTASSSLTNLVNNFDKADTNGDGKVSIKEAIAYDQKTSSSSTTSASTSTDANSSDSNNDLETKLLSQIMKLMQAYGIGGDQTSGSSLLSTLSVTA